MTASKPKFKFPEDHKDTGGGQNQPLSHLLQLRTYSLGVSYCHFYYCNPLFLYLLKVVLRKVLRITYIYCIQFRVVDSLSKQEDHFSHLRANWG